MRLPWIDRVDVSSYGCIKQASAELAPLHALIGPNDSGKSTLLRALRTAAQFGAGRFSVTPAGTTTPFEPWLTAGSRVCLHAADIAYQVSVSPESEVVEAVEAGQTAATSSGTRAWNRPGILQGGSVAGSAELAARAGALFSTPTMVRLDPDSLREASDLIPESSGIAFTNERGLGLAGVYDAIQNRDIDAFQDIQREVRDLFPSVAKLRLMVEGSKKTMAVTLVDGQHVGAPSMSEGLLYFLAFAALKHVTASRLFLVEEPENGLHPARIADVMRALRKMSETAQVVIATHSPLVVNELAGNEVSVVTRSGNEGTRVTLLEAVPGFADAAKVYLPGEFWVSYADGRGEQPLLEGTPRV